jgi:hypothetical protein
VSVIDAKRACIDKDIKLPATRVGVFVVKVIDGSPAELAGIKFADVITHIDNTPVNDADRFTEILMTLSIGQDCEIKYCRLKEEGDKVTWPSSKCRMTLGSAVDIEKAIAETEEANAKKCPLEITAGGIIDNIIGTPELTIKLTNHTKYDVEAYVIEAECFNKFDDPVRRPGSDTNLFRGIGQDTIRSGESDAAKWNLTLQETTSRAVVRIVRVKLSNGDEWNEDKDSNPSVTVTAKK